jgi:cytoskeletal protein CcmA (bactofilin family)
MEHLDEMTCLLYLEGQFDRERTLACSAHLDTCPSCSTLRHALERESRLLTRAMREEDEAVPARLLAGPGRAASSLGWAWVVSFGLAATGAYALYAGYVEPVQQRLEQAGFGGSNLMSLLFFEGAFWKGWQSMLTLLETLALITLGGVAIAFLRRRFRHWTALAVMMASLLALVGLPAAASAAECRRGQSEVIAKDQVIKNDLIFFGERLRIDGTVDGDVISFANSVDVNGHVTGDLIAFAQSLHVPGQIDGNIRSFANNATITGSVGKNVITFVETWVLEPTGKIGGSLTMFAKSDSLDGHVGRDLLAFTGMTTLNGSIGGGMHLHGDTLTIGPTAEIAGKALFEGHPGYKPDVSPQAKLGSPLEVKYIEHHREAKVTGHLFGKVVWYGILFLFGLGFFFLVPEFSEEAVRSASNYGASLGIGILVLFGFPIAALIACITLVGMAVGITGLLLWLTVLVFGTQLIVGAWLGEKLLGEAVGTGALVGRMALGLLIIRVILIGLSAVPYVSFVLRLVIALWAMGALSLAVYRRLSRGSSPATPGQQAPLPA